MSTSQAASSLEQDNRCLLQAPSPCVSAVILIDAPKVTSRQEFAWEGQSTFFAHLLLPPFSHLLPAWRRGGCGGNWAHFLASPGVGGIWHPRADSSH